MRQRQPGIPHASPHIHGENDESQRQDRDRAIAVCALLGACAQKPPAQATAASAPRKVKTCAHNSWCPINVVVRQDASGVPVAVLEWDEVRMLRKLPSTTILWQLYAGPDYEFRPNSVVASTNVPLAPAQFALRQITPTRFAVDDLNTDDNSYTYELRVYRKGADSAPLVARGTVVNVFN